MLKKFLVKNSDFFKPFICLLFAFFFLSLLLPALASAAETTTSAHLIKYAADGQTVITETTVDYVYMKNHFPVKGDGVTHYYHQGPVMEGDMWDPTRTINLKDQGTVQGTDLKDLCELIGGLSTGEKVRVKAADGFFKEFPYENIYSPSLNQGPIVLCWSKDKVEVPGFSDGMKIVFMSQVKNGDGKYVFGNQDMKECFPEAYWHFYKSGTQDYPSSSGYTVKYVSEVAIFSNVPAEPSWELELSGAKSEKISKAKFEEGANCHGLEYTDNNGKWKGIPLWYLMGWVDDEISHGPGAFNDSLAETGYEVKVTAGDGFSKTFSSKDLARNNNYIVACYLDGSPLPELDDKKRPLAPLKLVGTAAEGGNKVGNIVKISLDITPAPPQETLTITGKTGSKVYTLAEIKALPAYTDHGGFKKSTGAIVGPYKYQGVKVVDLLSGTGGLEASDSLKITASDGYSMDYTYDQVQGKLTTYNKDTGGEEAVPGPVNMVLAYAENDNPIPKENGGPLRIVFAGPDKPITDGHFWVKYISKIEVQGGLSEWWLELEGAIKEKMDRSTFESGASCHQAVYTDGEGNKWSGIPLYYLVGRVDDAASHDFNDELADTGYTVTVTAADGYAKTFSSAFVKLNKGIILANRLNEEVLPENNWPLKLTGPALKKGENVKKAAKITLTITNQADLWPSVITLPEYLQAGSSSTVTVRVYNGGAKNAANFEIILNANEKQVESKKVDLLAAGADTEISFTWTPENAGLYTLKVIIDPKNEILENNKLNNELTKDVQVASRPGSSGGGGAPTKPQKVEKNIVAGAATVAEISGVVKIEVPAGAVSGGNAVIAAETIGEQKAKGLDRPLLSKVVDVQVKNGTITGKINLTLYFDPKKLAKNQEPAAFYYEEKNNQWVKLDGVVDYDRSTATVSVEHLTPFAVFALPKEEIKPAVKEKTVFPDLQGHWAEAVINELAGMGIISGYPEGAFKPENKITRLEATALLARALKLTSGDEEELKIFKDAAHIPGWARKAVSATVKEGLLKGYEEADGTFTFAGQKLVNRAEMAVLAGRIMDRKLGPVTPAALNFTDAGQIPVWARQAVGVAAAKGVMSGYPDNTLQALNNLNRAEAATMIKRMLDLLT